MESFDDIKNIWKKANNDKPENINPEFIKNAMNMRSIGITARLLKSLNAGLVFMVFNILVLLYNQYFYFGNHKITFSIVLSLVFSIFSVYFTFKQKKRLISLDNQDDSLKNILIEKIIFFKTRSYWVLHLMAVSMAIFTYCVNLTMESRDGIFNISKIGFLVSFYVLIYVISFIIYYLNTKVYLKLLNNALDNLEAKILDSMEQEIRKNLIMKLVIIVLLILTTLSGIYALIQVF